MRTDLSSNVGRIGIFPTIPQDGTLQFEVQIKAFKLAYGNPRYLITPVSGTGSQWVSAERVHIVNGTDSQ